VSIARATEPAEREPQACAGCLRRTWLVGRLAGRIELARHAGRGAGTGALRELLALPDARLLAALGGQERHRIARELERVEPAELLAACARAGLVAVCRHDPDYPARLGHLDDAPAVLHVTRAGAGRLAQMVGGTLDTGPDAVAIVGTRRASAEGLEIARALGRGLAAAGVTVVSGMALGADSAAHAGALEAGGATVAVLACGADVPYPPSKRTLYARIARAGCAVSELPPGFGPYRWCFPARNRIIAALAQMTVVVEAAERSGSLITAELAADLGREVGAVPGPVTSWRAAGTNALLRDGATLVRDARDALDAIVGVEGEAATSAAPAGSGRAARPDPAAGRHRAAGLEPRLADLLDAVEAGRDTVAALAVHPAEAGAIVAGLTELELLGLLRRATGGRYVRAVAS
jgi:DNA processing protein